MWYILDDNDEPVLVDVLVAAEWLDKNVQRRVVAYDDMPDGSLLSTVFVGFVGPRDESVSGKDLLLYESLWFGGPYHGHMRRYKNKKEAFEGHADMLESYRDFMSHTAKKLADM